MRQLFTVLLLLGGFQTLTVFGALSEREVQVLQGRFVENKTLQKLSEELGVGRERIRQIEARIVRTVREQVQSGNAVETIAENLGVSVDEVKAVPIGQTAQPELEQPPATAEQVAREERIAGLQPDARNNLTREAIRRFADSPSHRILFREMRVLQILQGRFIENKTLKKLSEELGVPRERIRQLEARMQRTIVSCIERGDSSKEIAQALGITVEQVNAVAIVHFGNDTCAAYLAFASRAETAE